jgi:hypothetical protein
VALMTRAHKGSDLKSVGNWPGVESSSSSVPATKRAVLRPRPGFMSKA